MADAHNVAVTGIIIKNGKYLITKRSLEKKAFPGKWTVPGGNLEMSDYVSLPKDTSEHWYNVIEKTLRREIKEECGIVVGKLEYLTSITFIVHETPILIISMYAEHVSGEVILNEESVEYAWVTLEEAKEYDLIEGIYDELVMLDKKLKGETVGEWQKQE